MQAGKSLFCLPGWASNGGYWQASRGMNSRRVLKFILWC